jgi:hypothetical protein
LFLALINPTSGLVTSLYAVSQPASNFFPIANDNGIRCDGSNYCGPTYAGVWEDNNTLYISFSINKENVYVAVIPNVSSL